VISCREAVDQLWEYLDDGLHRDDREHVEAHLALCRRCCGEAEFTAALRELLRSSVRPDLPPDVEQHLVGFLENLEPEAP
jgi:anti-sigma factor (TIGR02949 family)